MTTGEGKARPTPVSVVIPVYNRSEYLSSAVASLLATGYPDLEIVIVDDGSTDGSLELAGTLARQHPEVRLLRHPDGGNHGSGPTRNLGIREAAGDYVGFLDSDDTVMPHRFATSVPLLDADPSLDGIHEWTSAQREAGGESRTGVRSLMGLHCPDPEDLLELMLTGSGHWSTNAILVRKRVLMACGGFSEALRRGQDLVLWLKLALSARLAEGAREPVAIYRLHHGNTSTTDPVTYFVTALNAYLEAHQWASGNAAVTAVRKARFREYVINKCFFACDGCRKSGRPDLARELLKRTAATLPAILMQRKFWGNLLHSFKERAVPAKA